MKSNKQNSPSIKSAMSKLGSIGGNAVVKKRGKGYMKSLVTKYWNSPAGRARKAVAKARFKGRIEITRI